MTIDQISEQDTTTIWKAFGRALGAEPRESPTIRGASGLDHSVEGISVDDKNNRVIIFAAEPNPRIAALMQVDIQATLPSARVLLARPLLFDIATIARGIVQQLGLDELDIATIGERLSLRPFERSEVVSSSRLAKWECLARSSWRSTTRDYPD